MLLDPKLVGGGGAHAAAISVGRHGSTGSEGNGCRVGVAHSNSYRDC